MNIGSKIKELREEKGLTQQECANILKIARSTLACYETDKNAVPLEILVQLAQLFNCTTDYILGIET